MIFYNTLLYHDIYIYKINVGVLSLIDFNIFQFKWKFIIKTKHFIGGHKDQCLYKDNFKDYTTENKLRQINKLPNGKVNSLKLVLLTDVVHGRTIKNTVEQLLYHDNKHKDVH